MTTASPAAADSRWPIRFFSIWITQAFSQIGSQITQFALIWWITQSVGSATALATASLMGLLPRVIIGPFAGVLVDRWNRKRVMIAADLLSMFCVLVVAYLFATETVQIWHLYGLMFIRSVCGAFQYPAMQATMPLIVPEAHLARVAGLNEMLNGGTNIVAPILSALLMTIVPLQGMLMVDVATALPAVAVLLIFVIPQPRPAASAGAATASAGAATASARPQNVWQDMREGLQFMRGFRGLLIISCAAMLVNFVLAPTGSLMPLLITKHFKGQVTDLAVIESVFGIAVIIGSLLLSVWGGFKRRIVTCCTGLAGLGIGTALIGLAPSNVFGLALAGMFLMGFMNTFANGSVMAIMQTVVPNHMQGRVMSLLGSAAGLMTPLSLAASGPLSDLLGLQVWYIVGGIGCVLTALLMFASPSVMHIETRNPNTTSAHVNESSRASNPIPQAAVK